MADCIVLYFTCGVWMQMASIGSCLNDLYTVGRCVWEGWDNVVLFKEVCH